MNTKGFTLVELLAVIVILAIIAIVTTPVVFSLVSNARSQATEDKAFGAMKAVELSYAQALNLGYSLGEDGGALVTLKTVDKKEKLEVSFEDGKVPNFGGKKTVAFSGEVPSGGKIIIDVETGKLTCDKLEFKGNGHYKCTGDSVDMECTPIAG